MVGSYHTGFPGDSAVKNLPAVLETQVQPLHQEDYLEKAKKDTTTLKTTRQPTPIRAANLLPK